MNIHKEIEKIMNDSPEYRVAAEFYLAGWDFNKLSKFLQSYPEISMTHRNWIENAFLDIKNGYKEVTEFSSCLNLAKEISKL